MSETQQLLVIPTPADFSGIARLESAAFAEKLVCDGKAESERNCIKKYSTYYRDNPQKISRCRIIKSDNGRGDDVVAACQLQALDDPGDLGFPPGMRHTLKEGEVYVEWIACHPDYVGKGLGSKLLKWAQFD